MKRTTIGSAVFAAPLFITSTLFAGGSALANQAPTIALQLDSQCVVSSTGQAYFALQNKNDFTVDVNYSNSANGATGILNVPANSFYNYAVPYDQTNPNNTTSFTADGWSSPSVTNAHVDVQCSADQLANVAPVTTGSAGTDNGGDTGTGSGAGDNSGSTDTGEIGGKGADTSDQPAATTNTAATLADTGASQILPFTAAALLAVAVLGTTVAVRKNIL